MNTELSAKRYEAMKAVVSDPALAAQLEAEMDFSPAYAYMRDPSWEGGAGPSVGAKGRCFDQMHDSAIALVEAAAKK